MTIRNDQFYMEGIWDWAILNGCFGDTRIEPTDIDGLVERNGKFLVLETKSPGVTIPKGQEIMFKSFVRVSGAVVIVIWGQKNNPEKIKVFSRKHPDGFDIQSANMEYLRRLVATWFDRANNAA